MKFNILLIFALILFSCQKDDINVTQTPLEMETISGTVTFINETGPHNPILVVLQRLVIVDASRSIDTLLDTIATTYTDANGDYVFDQIIPSDDSMGITITLPPNYKYRKVGDESPDGDHAETFEKDLKNYTFVYIGTKLQSDEIEANNNFKIVKADLTNKVSGYVYLVIGNEKKPLPNVTVWITNRNHPGGIDSPKLGIEVTNAEGYYEIPVGFDVKALVHIDMNKFPIPIALITDRKSIDETPDTDPDPLDKNSIPVDFVDFELDDQNNFYFYEEQRPNISGSVLLDTDNNGIGDKGIGNQRVELYKRSSNNNNVPTMPLIAAVNSKADGSFSFEYLEPGEYVLYFIGNGDYDIVKGYDQDQEAGETANPYPQFINVNLPFNTSQDALNYFVLKQRDCNQKLRLTEYWALCDTNIVCTLNELPIICVDENNKPITQLTGNKFKWTNMVTGEISNSDVIMCKPYEALKLTIDLTNGCSYNLTYSRDCPQDLYGGKLHLRLIQGGFQPNYAYELGEVVWTFDVFNLTLSIEHNITSPVSHNLVPKGLYTYKLIKNALGKYEMKLTSISNGVQFDLGQIGFENGSIFFDNGTASDGIRLTFDKI